MRFLFKFGPAHVGCLCLGLGAPVGAQTEGGRAPDLDGQVGRAPRQIGAIFISRKQSISGVPRSLVTRPHPTPIGATAGAPTV